MRFFETNRIQKIRFLVKVRSFWRSKRKKELLTFFFFVIISSFFWSLQWMKETVEADFNIPVRTTNVPKEILLTSELPKFLSVRIKEKGATIFSYYFNRQLPEFEINYKEIKIIKGSSTLTPDFISSRLRKKFAQGVEILSFYPETISLNFSEGESKTVPISLITSISTASTYGINGSLNVLPNKVTIYAPSKKLKMITQVFSKKISLTNLKDTITTSIELQKIDGVKMVPDRIRIFVPVEPFTEKKLVVPIEIINPPKGYTMRLFPLNITIVGYVAISRYNDVKASDFRVAVDFSDLEKNKELINPKYKIKLLKSSNFVNKIRIQPEEVEVLMEEDI